MTHVDDAGRLQTVSKEVNPCYWRLIMTFENQTGVPILLDTSFNENEPNMNTPTEVLDGFPRTKRDKLVLASVILNPGTT